MKDVELYARVRYAVQVEGLSERAAARRFGIDPRTVAKMMRFSVPPGYRRTQPPAKPKLGAFIAVIDGILTEDKGRPKKQQHTAKRIFERLRDEHGFTGGLTIVKDYVAGWRQRAREMFVPLVHAPGHAQVDFGEAIGVIGGVECKVHFFAFDLPHSDACFVAAYPAETKEAFCDGHVKAFRFFGGVPKSILSDYVPGHIIVVMCRSALCGGALSWRSATTVAYTAPPHNPQREVSQLSKVESSRHIGLRGNAADAATGG
jgi:transposase